MICTAIACLFIMIGMIIDSKKEHHESEPDAVTFNSFSTSLGTMFFAWGGSAMFPTIQVDMHHKDRFHLAVIAAYILLLIFYLPVSIVGYVIYGSDVQDNVLKNLPQNFFRYAVEILITGHLAMAFTIVLNPIFQGFEEVAHVPKRFCWQRALLRSAVVIFIALMAETVPNFGPILSFIGGSTVSILGFILPVICYVTIKLQATRLSGERLVNNIFR
jgi:vesicular inhibitory amino acid transporter